MADRRAAGRLIAVLALVVASSAPAVAHQNTRAHGRLDVTADVARLTLYVRYEDWDQPLGLDADGDGTITNDELAHHAGPIAERLGSSITARNGGADCPAAISTPVVALRGSKVFVKSVLDFRCAPPIHTFALRYDLFTRLHPGHQMLATVVAAGHQTPYVFVTHPDTPAEHTVTLAAPQSPASHTVGRFLVLGVEHIFTGYDHVLFLLALVAVGGTLWHLVRIVTAFTVAHSVTLALAVLGVVAPPAGLVEPVIAMSIVLIAAENVAFRDRFAAARVAVTFLFGLVHGFGFAGVLLEMQVPRDAIVAPLVGFNLGVELGQVAIVAIVFPGLAWLHRKPYADRVVRAASVAIGAAGLWWLVERTLLWTPSLKAVLFT